MVPAIMFRRSAKDGQGTPIRPRHRLRVTTTLGPGLMVAIILGGAAPARASHFRFGHLTWVPRPDIAPNTAGFTLTAAFRRDGYAGTGGDGLPVTGDVITESIGSTSLAFGGATGTSVLQFEVTAFSIAENWIIGLALDPAAGGTTVFHTYAMPDNLGAPWLAALDTCCRIGLLRNCANCFYRVETDVRFDIGNSSPVSSLPPIVNVPINTLFSFAVPALDAEGDSLTYRFATIPESKITDPIGPAGTPDAANTPTMNAATGVVTWDSTGGTALGDLFTMQAVIEESRAPTGLIGKSVVDFILRIVNAVGDPPVCAITPSGPFTIIVGDTLTFDVSGIDPNAGDSIALNAAGLPTGATMTPPLPLSGPNTGVSSSFSWTPVVGQDGAFVVSYSVTDGGGLQTLCSVNITVLPITCPELPVPTPDVLLTTVRYLPFQVRIPTPSSARGPAAMQAVRVSFVSIPPPDDFLNGTWAWVGPPSSVSENGGLIAPDPRFGVFNTASLQCTPEFRDWTVEGQVWVSHKAIVPDGLYTIQVIDSGCTGTSDADFSPPLVLITSSWGDLVAGFDTINEIWPPPDGVKDVIKDVVAILSKFEGEITAPIKVRADLQGPPGFDPGKPDRIIDINDVTAALAAFQVPTNPYPFGAGPVPCPMP